MAKYDQLWIKYVKYSPVLSVPIKFDQVCLKWQSMAHIVEIWQVMTK